MPIPIYRNTNGSNKFVQLLGGCGKNGEGVVKYYGCNLKCPFCFAQKYSYSNGRFSIDAKGHMQSSSDDISREIMAFMKCHDDLCYVRLTGGEPLLSDMAIGETIKLLLNLDSLASSDVRVILQTNGVYVGSKQSLSEPFSLLREAKHLKLLFEVSLKGTNDEEFGILSGLNDSAKCQNQLNAYWLLKGIKSHNVEVVARLGTGHHRNTIHFVLPRTGESMFLRRNWSHAFEELHSDVARNSPIKKMVAECINAEGDGGINNYLHRAIPGIARCLDSGLITSKTKSSKAIVTASTRYSTKQPLIARDLTQLRRDYEEFTKYFEPMGRDPARIYCGTDEFKPDHRRNCKTTCSHYPK